MRLIASTINRQLSCQRFYALTRTPIFAPSCKQIPSEMEVAPRYKLLTLLTVHTLFTLFTLLTILTLLPQRTLLTLLKMLKQVWSKMAIMPIYNMALLLCWLLSKRWEWVMKWTDIYQYISVSCMMTH